MVEITVKTNNPYDVVIGRGILPSLGNRLVKIGAYEKAVVVTDSIVAALYLEGVLSSLSKAGVLAQPIIIEGGERNKNLECYAAVLEAMVKYQLNRGGLVVSLGGGVVSDIAGFAAATYMRGVDCSHVPTTLLAVIDATIGGKTGVDFKGGKNLVGAFHQPRLVLADIDCLKTLPQKEFMNGVGEGIKSAVLAGGELAELLELGLKESNLERFCTLCVAFKRDVIELDEREGGLRRLLNLGHTFGHAIERLSGYTIAHGECVAKGLNIAARAAMRSGRLRMSDFERLQKMFAIYGIDARCPFDKEELLSLVKFDKKSEGSETVNFVAINGFADCTVEKLTLGELSDYVDACIS